MTPAMLEPQVVRYRVAGFWRRMAAAVLDLVIVVPVLSLVWLLVGVVGGARVPRWRELGIDYIVELVLGQRPLAVGGLLMGLIGVGLYFTLFHAARGQTLGKQLLGLRVITRAGERPRLLRAVGRTGGYLLSGAL